MRSSATATEETLRAHTRELIAGFKMPRVVHIVDGGLPTSGAGKILKRNLCG